MELDPEARRILSLVQDARTPGADDKARVEQRLAVALGAAATIATSASIASPAAATSASGLTTKAAGSAAALKWTIGGCALIAAAVATYAVSSDAEPSQARRPAPIAAPQALPAVVAAPAAFAPAPVAAPAKPSIEAAEPAADTVRARRAQPHVRPERGALGDELELLHAAQGAWRSGDAARALSLVSEHRARHPRSTLGLERDALRVLALCDLGRTEEATRLGRAWLTRASGSPLRASIERSCAMK
jgi:hypothetical protein